MTYRTLIAAALILTPVAVSAQTRLGDPATSTTLSGLSSSTSTSPPASAAADIAERRRAERSSTDAIRASQDDRRISAIARGTATSSAPLGNPASPTGGVISPSITPVP